MKRILSLMLVVLAVVALAACGKTEPESNVKLASEAPVYNPPAYLTGLEQDADYPQNQRATAMMVTNIAEARPQRGLSDADVLFEIKVEGGITRFMALFQDYKELPLVGPVRSARDQFFQLAAPTQSFFIHIGESVVQTAYLNAANYHDLDINADRYSDMIFWDKDRRAAGFAQEHTAYIDGERIEAHIEQYDLDPAHTYDGTFLNFQPFDEPARTPQDGVANDVLVAHSASYRSLFNYDESSGLYSMSQYNSYKKQEEPTVDQNNDVQLSFNNVIVLFTDIHAYPEHAAADLQKVSFDGGDAYYLSAGGYEKIAWQKGDTGNPLVLQTPSGENVFINPGKTYIAVVDKSEEAAFLEVIQAQNTAPSSDGSAAQ